MGGGGTGVAPTTASGAAASCAGEGAPGGAEASPPKEPTAEEFAGLDATIEAGGGGRGRPRGGRAPGPACPREGAGGGNRGAAAGRRHHAGGRGPRRGKKEE